MEGTINKDLNTIRHLLSYAMERGLIEDNPIEQFKNLKEDQKERPRFTDGQVQSVIDAAKPECTPLFLFIRETGCRREEALSLQHWQVQEESRQVVFSHNTKSRRFRYVPLTDAAVEAVKALPPLEGCPYVFYNSRTNNRWHDCRKPWEEAREKAGFSEMLVKDLRRHYAINLAEDETNMHDIQSVLGHASVTTTEQSYAQFHPEHASRRILKRFSKVDRAENGNKMETKRRHPAKPHKRGVVGEAARAYNKRALDDVGD